jgi:hypothetical protein
VSAREVSKASLEEGKAARISFGHGASALCNRAEYNPPKVPGVVPVGKILRGELPAFRSIGSGPATCVLGCCAKTHRFTVKR